MFCCAGFQKREPTCFPLAPYPLAETPQNPYPYLSQARRHYLTTHTSHFHSSLSLTSHRSLSSSSSSSSPSHESDSNPPPQQDPPRRPFQPLPIQPVSYPLKPEDPPPEDTVPSEAQSLHQPPPPIPPRRPPNPELSSEGQESRWAWTREDIRYVKDAPSITPVSYPLRVAPLPEHKVPAEKKGEGDVTAEANEEMEKERSRIEAEDQLKRRIVRAVEEEKMKVPFPLLIKPKQNEKPPVFDLTEAIRQVKANAKAKFDETVEAHVRLGIDSKRTELTVRGTVNLPHGDPKAISVAVFAEGAKAEEARAAGADIVGGKELIEELAIWTSHVMSSKLHESSMSERHEQWMAKHGKVYKDATEKEKRFVIFKDNVEFIESFNVAGDKPYKLGINHLADQTKEEFKTSRNGYNYKGSHGLRMIGSRNTIQV